jgi:DNA-binding protein HU-beta
MRWLIEQSLREGKSVTFPGFGTFKTSHRQGGKVKDIRTGEDRHFEERTVAYFHVGEVLKRAVNGKNRDGKPRLGKKKD